MWEAMKPDAPVTRTGESVTGSAVMSWSVAVGPVVGSPPHDEPDGVDRLVTHVEESVGLRRVECDRIARLELQQFESQLDPHFPRDDIAVFPTVMSHQ